ncbi:hypothetical protein HPB52_007620 [Rhipicephalus sanguineus]|uniref:BACK domain-containing protein n=1 Tax=Rhipicephalus sanguineus TaxID=34632 RepID=A0A9D4Q5H2_RHISA|nr:hypothetical protein HPB52_007620 [Rhipicephalus sanguineus]
METETTPTGQQILMFSAARRLNMAEEEQRAYHFLTAHFMSAVATREFLELDADDVIRLLSADALGCHCEEEVFEAAMRWLNHAPGERSPHSEKLMAAVRFDHMNPSELHHCLEYPGVAQMEPVKKIVLDAIYSWVASESGTKDIDKKNARHYTPLQECSNVSVTAENDDLHSNSVMHTSLDPTSGTHTTSDRSLADKPTYRPGGAFLVLKDSIKSTASANTLGASQGDDRDHMSTSYAGPTFRGSSSSFLRGHSAGGSARNVAGGLGDSSGSCIEETEERRVIESRTEEVRTVRKIRRSRSRNQAATEPLAIDDTVRYRTESGHRAVGPGGLPPITDRESAVSRSMISGTGRKVTDSRRSIEERAETENVSERAMSTSYASSQYSFGEVASSDRMRLLEGTTPLAEDVSPVASARPSTVSVGEIGAFSDRADSAARPVSSTSSMYSLSAEEQDLNALAPWKPRIPDHSARKQSSGFESRASDKGGSEKSFPSASAESIEMSDYKTIYGKSQSEEKQGKEALETIDEAPTAASLTSEARDAQPKQMAEPRTESTPVDQELLELCDVHLAAEMRRRSSGSMHGENTEEEPETTTKQNKKSGSIRTVDTDEAKLNLGPPTTILSDVQRKRGQGQFEQAIQVVPAKVGAVTNYLTGAAEDRLKAPLGSVTCESQKPGESSSDSDTSRTAKEIPERKTMSEPSFSKQTNIDGEIESVDSTSGQKATKTTTIKEESSFTDKEAFRMINGTEASTERSSTHIKVTDSVNSERPKEQNFTAPETNICKQKSLSGIASSTAPTAIQVPLSSLSQVLSQQPLKVVKRKVVLETVTKTVTEKKESVKAVTNQATGIEHKDSHLQSTTKEEVQSKREEETIESYESAANVRQGTVSNPIIAEEKQAGIVSSPVLGSTTKAVESPKESVASHSAPDIKGVKEQTCQTPEKLKRPKQPVAIRVHDDTLAEDEEVASRKEEPSHMDLEPKSILKSLNRPAAHQAEESLPDKHLGFQEAENTVSAPLPSVQPVTGTKKDDEDDSEEAAQPPPRFKFNRKDSIAVTKLRMMKQAEELSEEEDDGKKDSESFLASSAAADDRRGERHPIFKPPVVIDNEEPQPASTKDSVQSDKGVNASLSLIASTTQPLIEITGANASELKHNIIDNIQSKDIPEVPEVTETKLNSEMATGEVEKSQNETQGVRRLMEDAGECSNVTTSLEKKQEGTYKSFSDTVGGTIGGTETSDSARQKTPIKAETSLDEMLQRQNEGDADEKLTDNKTRGQGTHDEEQNTAKSEAHTEQSHPMDLLPVFADASQIQTQATVADEKAIMEPCVNRTVKEVKNVENSVVTSETEEVFYYPREKVTKKHISETKVLTETRSYTEIVIEPNYSESSLMPAIPEENEQLPIAAASSREVLTDKSSGEDKAMKAESQSYSLISKANAGIKTTPGSAVGWYNEDGTPRGQDHPGGQDPGHAGNNADVSADGNADGGMVTKEELERYMKIAKDLKLRRGSLMPSSGTLQSSEPVAVGTKKKPSLVMETRIELYGKGRVTFSFDAVAEEGTITGSVYQDDSQGSLVRRGAPSTTHTPKRMSIDVRAPPATPAPSMEAISKRSKSVDFGYNNDDESMQYEPQEPPNAVSQAAKRRHSEHIKAQPGEDLKRRRHSEPGTLSISKDTGEETSKALSATDYQSDPTIQGQGLKWCKKQKKDPSLRFR